jgi:ABC-2 type transport system ATP-binding protein
MELRIQNLSKRYSNGVQALDRVSLTIAAGMFGLLGPNGAGKSTLMRIIATLQEADSGSVTLEGDFASIDALNQKDHLREVLGYLPQEFGLYPKVTALQLLDHFAQLKGISNGHDRRVLVEALLRQTNLWDARNQNLGTFSGGMKQRFGIAQALLGNPKLIIVDEPTAGLDPEERVRFHNLLSEIGEHVIVILSTHIVSDVSDLCQSMAIINLGRVLIEGDPIQLARSLRGRIWKKLVARDHVAEYKQRLPVISSRLVTGRTLIRVYGDAPPDPDFEPVEPDLEDLYFWRVSHTGAAPEGAFSEAPSADSSFPGGGQLA